MYWYRLLWTSSLLIIFYIITNFDDIKSLSKFRAIMVLLFILSIAIGIDYLVFDLLATMEFHPLTQEHWTNILSVCIFTSSEIIGVRQLLRQQNSYIAWMLPALTDLFLKGIIAFLIFNNHMWFIWDTLRAVVLFCMIYCDWLMVTSNKK